MNTSNKPLTYSELTSVLELNLPANIKTRIAEFLSDIDDETRESRVAKLKQYIETLAEKLYSEK